MTEDLCMHPLCVRERIYPADPTSILGWLSRPNVDQLPMRGTFKAGAPSLIPETTPRTFCSKTCLFAWIDARAYVLAERRETGAEGGEHAA